MNYVLSKEKLDALLREGQNISQKLMCDHMVPPPQDMKKFGEALLEVQTVVRNQAAGA